MPRNVQTEAPNPCPTAADRRAYYALIRQLTDDSSWRLTVNRAEVQRIVHRAGATMAMLVESVCLRAEQQEEERDNDRRLFRGGRDIL